LLNKYESLIAGPCFNFRSVNKFQLSPLTPHFASAIGPSPDCGNKPLPASIFMFDLHHSPSQFAGDKREPSRVTGAMRRQLAG
jgi:hypothetical protein